MNEQIIKSRKAGRLLADTIIDLIGDDALDDWLVESLLKELSNKLLPSKAKPPDPKPEPLTCLEQTKMPMGRYLGKRFADIPLDYLDWLCREQEDFYLDLRAYLKHPENRRTE